MKKAYLLLFLIATLPLELTAYQSNNTLISEGKAFFEKILQLHNNFDPSIAELYSDQAFIQQTHRSPDGEARVINFPVSAYKELIINMMPMAEELGDKSEFNDCTYQVESGDVRINCTQVSTLGGYSVPFSILVGEESGDWVIKEAITESRSAN